MTGGFRGLGAIALALGLFAGCAAPDAPQPATIGPASGYEHGDWERYGIQNVPLHRIGEGTPPP